MRFLCATSSLMVLAAVLALTPGAAGATDATPDWVGGLEPAENSGGTQVEVDIFVRNKEGEPVLGLTRDHFHVRQDGEAVEVTRFSAFTREILLRPDPPRKPAAASTPDEVMEPFEDADPIYIVLYIDNANLYHADRSRVLRSLQVFAQSVLSGPAQIMVVTHEEGTNIVLPFTDDPREVVMSLRKLRTTPTFLEDVDDDYEEVQRKIRRTIKNRNKTPSGRQQVLADLYEEVIAYARGEERRLLNNLQGIHEIGSLLTGINGRKHIVYVSNGLPLIVGKGLFHEFAGLSERMSTTALTIPFNKRRYFNSLSGAANGQQITIHAVDATGTFSRKVTIGDTDSPRAVQAATMEHENHLVPLRMVTEKTGGMTVINTDDFDAGFDRLVADLMTYYTVGYTIPTVGVDRVHEIEIALADGLDHDLRYRRAFIEKSLQSEVQEQVNACLFVPVDENPMGLKVSFGGQKEATPDRAMQSVRIAVPMRYLAFKKDGEDLVAEPVVFVATRDYVGRSADIQRRTHEVRISAAEYEKRQNEDVVIELDLLMEFGRHSVAVALLDEITRRAGFAKAEAVIRGRAPARN